jgi:hypothetical protein
MRVHAYPLRSGCESRFFLAGISKTPPVPSKIRRVEPETRRFRQKTRGIFAGSQWFCEKTVGNFSKPCGFGINTRRKNEKPHGFPAKPDGFFLEPNGFSEFPKAQTTTITPLTTIFAFFAPCFGENQPGLTPGQEYTIQIRALGGSTGQSDWSDPVKHRSL